MSRIDRRDFIKRVAAAAASTVAVPAVASAAGRSAEACAEVESAAVALETAAREPQSRLIVPKADGLPITGAFLDEISHDIPHQNWGEKEWDADFRYMKAIGIDTVIEIRSGYRKFITYPRLIC